MTQKELLYMEDAVQHECNMAKICGNTIDALEDKSLVSFLKSQQKKHDALKEKLLKAMEDSINE